MAELARVRALIPQPWFPLVKARRLDPPIPNSALPIDTADMFYLPGIGKRFDGRWMERCVERWLGQLDANWRENCVLDAHFGYPEGVGCYRLARRLGLPIFITLRGLEVELFKTASHGPQLLEALCNATGVIAVSHSLKAAAVEAGVPAEQITVIPNGVDNTIYHPGDKAMARRLIGYNSNRKLIVCVGNLKPVKGHDILLRAIAQSAPEVDLQLVCIGGGLSTSWGLRLQELATELKLGDRIQFIGAHSPAAVANWLRAADLFTLASRREGCCNAVLEAMSTGLPVAATDAGDNRILVNNQGQIVPTEDPSALARAITQCLNQDFDQQAIAKSTENSTWAAVAQMVIDKLKTGLS
jgi:teichuronic acid biosynthesis glycosyltransferase TuaC